MTDYRKPREMKDIIAQLAVLGYRQDMNYLYDRLKFTNMAQKSILIVSDDGSKWHYCDMDKITTHDSEEYAHQQWYIDILDAINRPLIEPGTLVVYDSGYKVDIGKVKRLNKDGSRAFVWYDVGDTATCTNINDLYPVSEQYALEHKGLFENGYAVEEIIKKKK